MMARIGPKDTKPEMIVRKGLHGLGFRFRLHSRHLVGKPDLVVPKYGAAVFINGCFWHAHKGCSYFRLPKTRTEFWREKLAKNVERDQKNAKALIASGWRVLTVWECATKRFSLEDLLIAIAEWLRGKEIFGELPNKSETV
jgi:DNA mismatch endonuclease (patch repair protein)